MNDTNIDRLQRYYGLAIPQSTKKNNNPIEEEVDEAVQKMKTAVKAAMHHCIKNKDPVTQHRFCKQSKDSWCKWQDDKVTGL